MTDLRHTRRAAPIGVAARLQRCKHTRNPRRPPRPRVDRLPPRRPRRPGEHVPESPVTTPDEAGEATLEDELLHPRPQFARASWTELDGPWQFAYDDEDRGLEESWDGREDVFDREIVVPFPPESRLSGIH